MMTNDEMRDDLRQKLTTALSAVMGNNELDNQQQLEVLGEMFLSVLRLYGEFQGEDPTEFAESLLLQLVKVNNPDCSPTLPMEDVKNHRSSGSMGRRRNGGFPVDSPDNAWLKVFPAPLTADKMIDYLMLQMGHKFDSSQLPGKMQGVLLTSMPDADKAEIKQRMKDLLLKAVGSPTDHRLRYVVFGAGMQASKKTEVIRDRIQHNELIDGIYFEEFYSVLDELEKMKDEEGE